MSKAKIRVLVVDDSAVIRQRICDCIAASEDMEVAGTAHNGRQALELFPNVAADVVTLDIQMPDMDGLATLEAILNLRPVPVIMVSSLTQRGACATFDALERGAMDCVAKPERGSEVEAILKDDLLRKIRCFAGTNVKRVLEIRQDQRDRHRPIQPHNAPADVAELASACIVIGISTGGPPALSRLFAPLRAPMPPIVVVQHMPAQFTGPLAARLDGLSPLSIKEAEAGDLLRPNRVLIAPGAKHLELQRRGDSIQAVLRNGEPISGHKPSVDVLMRSAAAIYGSRLLAVIMTGMGRDGVEGCRMVRAAGGFVLGQDEASSDVYGMNKIAFAEGHVDRQFNLNDAAVVLTRQAQRLLGYRRRLALAAQPPSD